MSKCDFNKVAKQLYWNRILARVFCKFVVNFQNTFSEEHLFRAASVKMKLAQTFVQLLKNISYMFLPLLPWIPGTYSRPFYDFNKMEI